MQNAEKYHWRPRQLLAQISKIYVQLAAADTEGIFARSIAMDERCYRPSMFEEAANVSCLSCWSAVSRSLLCSPQKKSTALAWQPHKCRLLQAVLPSPLCPAASPRGKGCAQQPGVLQVLQNDVTTADYTMLQQLRALGGRVSTAAQDVKADEEMAEEAPDEFKVRQHSSGSL